MDIYQVGTGRVTTSDNGLRLTTRDATARVYSDVQIDDYGRLSPSPIPHPPSPIPRLPHRPPLTIRLRARFSHPAGELRGTAGFGLWNYPWARLPVPPRAIWFFYASSPSDMPLALGVPGRGWKAAVIDTGRPQALALLPLAPLAVPLMRSYAGYRVLWPHIQRAVGVAEAPLEESMEDRHSFVIIWGEKHSSLAVDGHLVLEKVPSPRGPMCFVAWIDNQYFIVTPQGRFGWGLLDAPGEQWLELEELSVE